MSYKNKEKQREYQRLWLLKQRAEWIHENGPCANCGSTEKLEVDHIDGTKKVNHRVWSWSKERRAAELKKCQVLCNSCHKQKTKNDLYGDRQHGTRTMYTNERCRCALCVEANRRSVMRVHHGGHWSDYTDRIYSLLSVLVPGSVTT